jgi:hypothetical protein
LGSRPRRAAHDIDAVTEDVAADVDADAVLDTPVFGCGRLAFRHAVLDRDRALYGIDGACKLDQGAVAGELRRRAQGRLLRAPGAPRGGDIGAVLLGGVLRLFFA